MHESTHVMQNDIVNVVKRLDPIERHGTDGFTKIDSKGWARMGVEKCDLKINEIGCMQLGTGSSNTSALTSYVHGEFMWDVTKLRSNVKKNEKIKKGMIIYSYSGF